jgi:alpha,alpha-trehalase
MSDWLLTYDGFDPAQEGLREALCTVGNGYFATRGAAPESSADGVHYPGTYISGVYNRLSSEIAGRIVENESLVNAPNWLPLRFRIDGGPWFGSDGTDVVDHHLELDLHRAVLTRQSRFRDPQGRQVRMTQRRFVSMRDAHLAAMETTLVAENWSGVLEVCSALDGTVRNDGVPRYRLLPSQHLVPICTDQENHETVCLQTTTSQSHIRIAMAARTRLQRDGEPLELEPSVDHAEGYVAMHFDVDLDEGQALTVEKIVAVFTSRDPGISEPGMEACDWARRVAGSFDELLTRHVVTWNHIWDRVHIDLGTDGDLSMVLRLHILHLIQTTSNHVIWHDVGVPARGLHGEAYRGHIFWDELFVVPFLSVRLPQLTRALLLYRYRRMDQARRAASEAGYAGAMFPWQSASNGREETQTMHLNPQSGNWLPDASHLQRHVNAAIAFNVWQYYQATHDLDFLRFYGGEMILEIARFWGSIATYNRTLDRYDIKGVMGPDEYHERYPDRDEPGLDNNAYTNIMAVWCLCRAFDVLDVLPERSVQDLKEHLGITQPELDRWGDVSRKMRVCFHDGVVSQFEGYEQLEELDWESYREKYGDIHRLDRILEAEGDTANRYKLTKQADVMMLFYLLSAEELGELFERLGYEFGDESIPQTIDYYESRTSHGSTLSRVVHSWVYARRDRERSWNLFVEALHSDVADVQGGTTPEGIHLGAMAGTVDLLQRCYSGLEMRGDVLRFNPVIPEELGSLDFDLRYREHLIHVHFTTEVAQIRVDLDEGAPIDVEVGDECHRIQPCEILEVAIA